MNVNGDLTLTLYLPDFNNTSTFGLYFKLLMFDVKIDHNLFHRLCIYNLDGKKSFDEIT